ncbi:MFS transporter [Arthrobacter sp. SAFR-044]|uniref:MFS transporter n=1 Tax=Arthrobacter sp. SAFR-044 TaxID=3387278 RepID=UPI003F7BBA33
MTETIADTSATALEHQLADTAASRELKGPRLRSTIGAGLLTIAVSGVSALGFMVVPAAKEFGVAMAQYLVYYSLWTIGGAVTMAIIGRVYERVGVRPVITIGGIVATASLTGMALAPNIYVIYLCGLLTGAAFGTCTVMAATTIITLWHSRNRASVLGIVFMGTGIGGFLWGFIMPQVVKNAGWRMGYAALAISVFVLIVGAAVFLIRNPPVLAATAAAKKTDAKATALKVRPAAFVIVFVATFLISLPIGVTQVLPSLLGGKGIPALEIGAIMSVMSIGMMLSKPLQGVIADRIGLSTALAIAAASSTAAFLILAYVGSNIAVTIATVLVAVGNTPLTVLLPIVIAKLFGQVRFSRVYGVAMMFYYFGQALATPLWGLNFDLTGGYTIALLLAVTVSVLGLAGLAVALRMAPKD